MPWNVPGKSQRKGVEPVELIDVVPTAKATESIIFSSFREKLDDNV